MTRCSFCNKPKADVAKLVEGSGVFICDACIGLRDRIVAEHAGEASAHAAWGDAPNKQELLAQLPQMLRTSQQIENNLGDWVRELRRRG